MTFRTSQTAVIPFYFALVCVIGVGCDSDSGDSNNSVTGTLTATVGGVAYSATSLSKLTSSGLTIRTTSDDGRILSLTFLGISSDGQYALINRALDPAPGVAGGFSAGGETYNIDTGTVNLSAFTSDRITGTFSGTATGLLGAANLTVIGGSIDVRY